MEKKNIEDLLDQGITIQIQPIGYSMYPMFVPDRDFAILKQVPVNTLRRGDVVLYRRLNGPLVLHRIYRKDTNGFYMVGDGQSKTEGPLDSTQIKGKLLSFIRNGKTISVKHPIYRAAVSVWLILLPIRRPIQAFLVFIKRSLPMQRRPKK
ncbi:MAG: S26 family signal peptidase [Lachnospiraceae bacterium]|jgi:hypothetical protein|nr:S26 family signal peptidase [Lachnospiraceae bacterium]